MNFLNKNNDELLINSRNRWLLTDYSNFIKECNLLEFQTRSAGGQHVNRKYSAIRVIHNPTKYTSYSSNTRSQYKNKQSAVYKIKIKIALNIRVEKNAIIKSSIKYNFINNFSIRSRSPIWIAIILDLLLKYKYDSKIVAETLGISTTRLIKILYNEIIIWRFVNQCRNKVGLKNFMIPRKR